jgi:hypothetical protein
MALSDSTPDSLGRPADPGAEHRPELPDSEHTGSYRVPLACAKDPPGGELGVQADRENSTSAPGASVTISFRNPTRIGATSLGIVLSRRMSVVIRTSTR